jgi:hypothetical protein
MINNRVRIDGGKLPSSVGTVYTPVLGWSYSHHAHLAFFKGKFFAAWSNGKIDEDDLGQRVMLATSPDALHWENLHPVATPDMLGDEGFVLTAAGFHTHMDTLYLFFGAYRYEEGSLRAEGKRPKGDVFHKDTQLFYVSTTDGEHWSSPTSTGLAMVPNHGPQRTRSGRLIISGNIAFPYTDSPDGVSGYRMTGIYGDCFGDGTVVDDSDSIHKVTKHQGWDTPLICEGSFYQTDDGVLHMLLRSNSPRLWVSESHDDGVHWSSPVPTEYSDDGTKFHAGRLPDGRFYCIGNATVGGKRCPLELFLSQNGEDFDHRYILRDERFDALYPGMYKGGLYGYPHSLIRDGYLYVIYSKHKEEIEVTRVDLRDL